MERAQHIRVDWKGGEEEEEEEEHFHLSPAKDSSCGLIYSSDPIEWWKYLASLLDLIELVTISVFSQPTSAWCNQRGRTRIRPDTAHTHTLSLGNQINMERRAPASITSCGPQSTRPLFTTILGPTNSGHIMALLLILLQVSIKYINLTSKASEWSTCLCFLIQLHHHPSAWESACPHICNSLEILANTSVLPAGLACTHTNTNTGANQPTDRPKRTDKECKPC